MTATVEVAQEISIPTRGRSIAVVVKAPPTALLAIPPSEFDGQIEEPMDYSPVEGLAAPEYPAEQWPENAPGPLGY